MPFPTYLGKRPFFGTVLSEKILPSARTGRTVLGGQSTDWVIDQYQTSTESPRRPAASLATPTIPTKSEYIVGQVVRASIETAKLVNSLPDTASGKAKKARECGVSIIAECPFWQKLGKAVD